LADAPQRRLGLTRSHDCARDAGECIRLKPSATNQERTGQSSLTILIQGSIRVSSGDHLMSSISSLGSSQNTYSSPLQQLEAELQSEVSGPATSNPRSTASSRPRSPAVR